MNTVVDYVTLPTPAAWIGYDRQAFRRGYLLINICAECDGTALAESVARRLQCKTFRTLCPRHIAERTARITGDRP